jgi:glyoxylase-like metal-dependent hydrolase (beta-lactamase superfamily II)
LIRIGDFEITRAEEVVLDEPVDLLAGFTDDIRDANVGWMSPNFYSRERNVFYSVIQTWILRHGSRTIIIDTGGGDGRDRPLSPRFHMTDRRLDKVLADAGVVPEEVDTVFLTHLHVDHVGWNTRKVGDVFVPMFPNARHIVSATELEARDPERGARNRPPAAWNTFLDSVKPIVDAGLVDTVEGTETLGEGLDMIQIPGHAPGMIGLRVRSKGEEAIFIADVMHQPIQVHYPEWNSKYCENQDLARETRAKVLKHAADEGSLLLPAHFGQPYCGYVRREGSGYRFEPAAVTP